VIEAVSLPSGPELPPNPKPADRNQALRVRFSQPLLPGSVFRPERGNGLSFYASVTVTYFDGTGALVTRDAPGLALLGGRDGFGRSWSAAQLHIAADLGKDESVFTFVADRDADPSTPESFLPAELVPPASPRRMAQVRLAFQPGLEARSGRTLATPFCATFSVGPDGIPPTVLSSDPPSSSMHVPLDAPITVEFSEPIRPASLTYGPSPVGAVHVESGQPGSAIGIPGTLTLTPGNCGFVFRPARRYLASQPILMTIIGGPPGANGIVDLAGNPLVGPGFPPSDRVLLRFAAADGPGLSNNPVTADAIVFATQSPNALGVVEIAPVTGRVAALFPQDAQGSVLHPLDAPVDDLILGAFLDPTHTPATAPRPCGPSTPPLQYCPPTGPPRGNFLYVADGQTNRVHVIRSDTFEVLKSIPLPDPTGLAIEPAAMNELYVSNAEAGSLSVVDVRVDATGLPRGTVLRTIPVGRSPQGVAAQPDGEDVLVCNSGDASVSIVSVPNLGGQQPVRKTITGSVGPEPWEVSIGGRIPGLVYYAYIVNRAGNSVSIYESGPDLRNGFGRDAVVQVFQGLPRPVAVTDDQSLSNFVSLSPAINVTGAWVACGDGVARHIAGTNFSVSPFPNPPPGVYGPRFAIVSSASLGTSLSDIVLEDAPYPFLQKHWPQRPPVNPLFPLPRIGVASSFGTGEIVVFDLQTGIVRERLPVPAPRRLASYYKQ
jgi:DNA-binding beta-propeller fold protein YncE